MEYKYSTYNFNEELLEDKKGYWKVLAIIDYPDLEFNDDKRKKLSLINNRMSALKVWYSNGPQYYVLAYSHDVTSYNKNKKDFFIDLRVKDKNNNVTKNEMLEDNINQNDKNRRSFWTFDIKKEELNNIFSSSANLLFK